MLKKQNMPDQVDKQDGDGPAAGLHEEHQDQQEQLCPRLKRAEMENRL